MQITINEEKRVASVSKAKGWGISDAKLEEIVEAKTICYARQIE